MNNSTYTIIGLIVVVMLGIGVSYLSYVEESSTIPSEDYTAFAQCIADTGALFYGAFWCPHCQNQKRAFGDAQKLLPYIECSTPDGQSQLDICKEAGVTNYPTWKFADGSILTGEIPLPTLAEKTGCFLPGATDTVLEGTPIEEGETSSAL